MATFKPDDTVTIEFDRARKSISVTPEHALIFFEAPLAWRIRGLESMHHVEIDFSLYGSVKGPFRWPSGDPGSNPVRGRFVQRGDGEINSAPSDKVGYWKYTVIVRDDRNKDLASIDPGVMIKK